MVNLISNSLKFTYSGFIKISIESIFDPDSDFTSMLNTPDLKTIVPSDEIARLKVDRLKFTVEDSGIGIKEEDFNKLFKMFGQVKDTNDVNPKGIGLGLTICNKILL